MSYDVKKLYKITDEPDGTLKVWVRHADMIPAGIARIKEIRFLIEEKLGDVDAWRGLGVNGQMRFAIANGITDAEMPMIAQAFFAVPAESWDHALQPVWSFDQATLQPKFEMITSEAEAVLFGRSWALDSARALFMRSVRSVMTKPYNIDMDRDLKYKNAWIPEPATAE